jgi:hypothetical protein
LHDSLILDSSLHPAGQGILTTRPAFISQCVVLTTVVPITLSKF